MTEKPIVVLPFISLFCFFFFLLHFQRLFFTLYGISIELLNTIPLLFLLYRCLEARRPHYIDSSGLAEHYPPEILPSPNAAQSKRNGPMTQLLARTSQPPPRPHHASANSTGTPKTRRRQKQKAHKYNHPMETKREKANAKEQDRPGQDSNLRLCLSTSPRFRSLGDPL